MRAGLNAVFWEPGVVTSIILPELLEIVWHPTCILPMRTDLAKGL